MRDSQPCAYIHGGLDEPRPAGPYGRRLPVPARRPPCGPFRAAGEAGRAPIADAVPAEPGALASSSCDKAAALRSRRSISPNDAQFSLVAALLGSIVEPMRGVCPLCGASVPPARSAAAEECGHVAGAVRLSGSQSRADAEVVPVPGPTERSSPGPRRGPPWCPRLQSLLPSSLVVVGRILSLSVLLAIAGVVVIVIRTSDTATTLVPLSVRALRLQARRAGGATGAERQGHDFRLMPHALGAVDLRAPRHRGWAQAVVGTRHGSGLAIQRRGGVVPSDLQVQLARGTRAESAQLATIALENVSPDARRYLMAMAGAQRGDWRGSR